VFLEIPIIKKNREKLNGPIYLIEVKTKIINNKLILIFVQFNSKGLNNRKKKKEQ